MKMISGYLDRNHAVGAIFMYHDICYRGNNTKEGKHKCDDIMLQESDTMQPRGFCEKLERKLACSIIGKKRKLDWGIEWSDDLAEELHKPTRRKFVKRRVFASGTDAIMIIDVFSKYGYPIENKDRIRSS